MTTLLKDLLFSSIFVLVTYFGFMHNVELLQILIGILYAISLIVTPIVISYLYRYPEGVLKHKDSLKNSYKLPSLILSLIVVSATVWIFSNSTSYNFLAIYSIIVILASIVRYKIYTIIKTK